KKKKKKSLPRPSSNRVFRIWLPPGLGPRSDGTSYLDDAKILLGAAPEEFMQDVRLNTTSEHTGCFAASASNNYVRVHDTYHSPTHIFKDSCVVHEMYDLPHVACAITHVRRIGDYKLSFRVTRDGISTVILRCPKFTFIGHDIAAVTVSHDYKFGGRTFTDPLTRMNSNAHEKEAGARCLAAVSIIMNATVPDGVAAGEDAFDTFHVAICTIYANNALAGSCMVLENYKLPDISCGIKNAKVDDGRILSFSIGDYGMKTVRLRCPRVTYSGYANTRYRYMRMENGKRRRVRDITVIAEYDSDSPSLQLPDPLRGDKSQSHTREQGERCVAAANRIMEVVGVHDIPDGEDAFNKFHNAACVFYERDARQVMRN
ncbi:hypothetical protein FOZ62_015309, partial [Perkinsus olseni]